jgi:hypothetical protein
MASLSLSLSLSLPESQQPHHINNMRMQKPRRRRRKKRKEEIEVYRRSDRAEVLQHTSIHYAVCTEGKKKRTQMLLKREKGAELNIPTFDCVYHT